jgi:hypothetical protein
MLREPFLYSIRPMYMENMLIAKTIINNQFSSIVMENVLLSKKSSNLFGGASVRRRRELRSS